MEPGDPRLEIVSEENCFNSTDLGVADIYTMVVRASGQSAAATSAAVRRLARSLGWLPAALGLGGLLLL